MNRHDLVWQSFLPLESIKLGRLVLNLDEPYQDYLDPACDLTPEILKKPQLRFLDVQKTATNTGLTAELTSLASASRSNQKAKVGGSKASLKDQEARKWIEEVIGTGEDVYMVVGYQTMVDARVLGDVVRLKSVQARLQLPVSEVASATGAVTMISGLADPGLNIYGQSDDGSRRQFVAAGEQVYAVQYRKVRFKWFSSRDLDRASLEKGNRWKVHGSLRGQEVGTNDVVEAAISEDEDSDGE